MLISQWPNHHCSDEHTPEMKISCTPFKKDCSGILDVRNNINTMFVPKEQCNMWPSLQTWTLYHFVLVLWYISRLDRYHTTLNIDLLTSKLDHELLIHNPSLRHLWNMTNRLKTITSEEITTLDLQTEPFNKHNAIKNCEIMCNIVFIIIHVKMYKESVQLQ